MVIDYTKLTPEIYDSICGKSALEEMFVGSIWENTGYGNGNYHWPFDKNDPKMCKEVWKPTKEKVMKRWKQDPNNAGKKLWLWWEYEAPEKPKVNEESEEDCLRRLGLLEDWEEKEIENQKKGIYKKQIFTGF